MISYDGTKKYICNPHNVNTMPSIMKCSFTIHNNTNMFVWHLSVLHIDIKSNFLSICKTFVFHGQKFLFLVTYPENLHFVLCS